MVLVLHEVFKVLEGTMVERWNVSGKTQESYDDMAKVYVENSHRSLAVAPNLMNDILTQKYFHSNAEIIRLVQKLYTRGSMPW